MTVGRRTKENHPAKFDPDAMKKAVVSKGWNAAYLRRILQLYGVNPKVDQIMNGHRAPSGSTAALIAYLLEIPLGLLYTIDEVVSVHDAMRQLGRPRLRRGRPRLHEQGVNPSAPTGSSPIPEPVNVTESSPSEKNL